MKQFGLIGKSLSHSFSKSYFSAKFEKLKLDDHEYGLFEIADIKKVAALLHGEPHVLGFNVTIPYKEAIIPFLTHIDEKAKNIGAVNTLVRQGEGNWVGYNTDYFGFVQSLQNHCEITTHQHALVLGTGGASKAVALALSDLGLQVQLVSRNSQLKAFDYHELNEPLLRSHTLIVNTTPLGMYPDVDSYPALPFEWLGPEHFCMDLVYNPATTLFLKKAGEQGAGTLNGLEMLHLQAEKAWEHFQQAF